MSTQVAYVQEEQVRQGDTASRGHELGEDALLPVMEGARARGIADAYDLIGQGAILLDETGGVLHAGRRALQLMGEELSVQSGHLVAQTATANHAIQQLVAAILDDGESGESIVVSRSDGLPALQLRAFSFEKGTRSPYQMLAVVLLVDEFRS